MLDRRLMTVAGLLWGLGLASPAADLTVMSAGAVEPGLKAAAAAFEKESGHKVKITFNTAPRIRELVAAGETFDVLVSPPAVIADFLKAGKVEPGGVDLGRVGSGVAVRAGAPVPAIATRDDIRKTVLEADSVVFNRASTGTYFEALLRKMGIWEQVEPKSKRYASGDEVMAHTLKGKGKEVAFGAITEILLRKDEGLVFVGPLPPEIQNYTSYVATPMTAGAQKEAARALVKFLGTPAAKRLFVAAGID
jgi:molybdate transport system substrate-binding protein